MQFNYALYAAVVASGALLLVGYLHYRLEKLERRINRWPWFPEKEKEDGTLPLPLDKQPPSTRITTVDDPR